MRISAKGRYGLASMIYLAQYAEASCVTVLKVSEDLGISKIYLEQVFSLLKKASLVNSLKGSSGGYQLSRPPEKISAFDILHAVDTTLFENTEPIASEKSSHINEALRLILWTPLDNTVNQFLRSVPLNELVKESANQLPGDSLMYYI